MLDGWRFIIARRGGANIVRSPGARVYGVLWAVNQTHIAALNGWEGVAHGVYRRTYLRVTASSGDVTALTYIARRRWPGPGSVRYLTTAILPGACAFRLPKPYRDELASWLPARPIGPTRLRYRGRRSRKTKARQLV